MGALSNFQEGVQIKISLAKGTILGAGQTKSRALLFSLFPPLPLRTKKRSVFQILSVQGCK